MPCSEPRMTYSEMYNNSHEQKAHNETHLDLSAAKREVRMLEAALCALLSELDRRIIGESVVQAASRKGLIDIVSMWDVHKKDDASRLLKDIHERYSVDEQLAIVKLITEANLKDQL